MVTVIDQGGLGYAATSDLSGAGVREAIARARRYAKLTAGRSVIDYRTVEMPRPEGAYRSPVGRDPASLSRRDKYELLAAESKECRIDDRIVDWEASLWSTDSRQAYFTADGGAVEQEFHFVVPNLSATAHAGAGQVAGGGVAQAALVDHRDHRAALRGQRRRLGRVLAHREVFAGFLGEAQRAEIDGGGGLAKLGLEGFEHWGS